MRGAGSGSVRLVSGTPRVPGEAASPDEVIAGLRAANTWLRECPCCGTCTKAEAPEGVTAPVQYGLRVSALAAYLWHGQFLSRDRAAAALGEMFGCTPSPA